jgi:uncharacterized protein YdhG (YjbR/CyaY superfamily)
METERRRFKTVDDYIASFPAATQAILEGLRRVIRESAPGAEEAISYGIPTFKLNGNLVHFAAYKRHIGFYPTASGIAAFKNDLASYRLSKGTVQFPLDRAIPFRIVKRIVRYRVKEQTRLGERPGKHRRRPRAPCRTPSHTI